MTSRILKPHNRFAAAVLGMWTVGGVLSLSWNLEQQSLVLEELARTTARTGIQKDIDYRRWASLHGGVYVPVTPSTLPNPYLEGLPERDLVTPSGRHLTLMNPAYMNRQVHGIERESSGLRSHLTSLRPLRPENGPDPWERGALERLESGEEEVSQLAPIEGREHMRLARPIRAEPGCLKCHVRQGFRVGDVVGGLSVSVAMSPIRAAAAGARGFIWFWHLLGWGLGAVGILFSLILLDRRQARQEAAEDGLRHSLAEKDVLLREVHHRVKNNLQVVSGLLELQASQVTDESARAALRESRNRLRTMALTHERLYRSGDLGHVDLGDYLGRLAEDLLQSYGADARRIALALDLAPTPASLDIAIPCGLIVSELLANAVKYAFPGAWRNPTGAVSTVSLLLVHGQVGRVRLQVSDNGIGLPEGFDMERGSSLGLKLVRAITEQLGGSFSLRGDGGLAVEIDIPLSPPAAEGGEG